SSMLYIICDLLSSEFNKCKNVAFDSSTSNTTRFGERTEIIYTDTHVPYTWEWVFHEGIDRHTVNNDFQAAVADRLDLQAQAKVNQFNQAHSKFISDSAVHEEELASFSDDDVLALFNDLSNYFVNMEAVGDKA